MYNLRSRKTPDTEEPDDLKRQGSLLTNPRRKIRKCQDKFDSTTFTKGTSYDGIVDSSDSTNSEVDVIDPDFIPIDDQSEQSMSSDESDDSDTSDTNEVIIDTIIDGLKNNIPDISEEEIEQAISISLKSLKELSKSDIFLDDSLKEELKELRAEMKAEEPNLEKILMSQLSRADKIKAVKLYDRWRVSDSVGRSEIETELRYLLDQKILELRNKVNEKIPTLEKIINANLTEVDKIRALQLYESLIIYEPYTLEWCDIQKRLNELLDASFENIDTVKKIELEEISMKDNIPNYQADLKRKIFDLDTDLKTKTRIYGMYCDMISRSPTDSTYQDLKNKIQFAIQLPYRKMIPTINTSTPDDIRKYCVNVYNELNSEIYGMNEAKEQIIQTVNDRIYNPNSYAILALKGPPGVGKTKLAKTIAKAVGKPFEKISLGGVIDSTIFKGSDNVWSGASPSLLLQILSRVKCSEPVVLLDEIDKLGTTEKGREVQFSLLHILDPTQNTEFQDLFLNEFNHDISKIWFIPAMNDDSDLDPALRDRLNIINVPPYSRSEMMEIIKLHTLPETLKDKGINIGDVSITDGACEMIIQNLEHEVKLSGLRPVEKAIRNIVSKLNLLRSFYTTESEYQIPLTFKVPDFKGFPYIITENNLSSLFKEKKSDHHFDLMYC